MSCQMENLGMSSDGHYVQGILCNHSGNLSSLLFSVFVIGGSKICQDLQKNVCEILVCPLHIARTHLLSINLSQLCAAKQITKGTLVSLLPRMSHVITLIISPVNMGISFTLRIMLMHL